ncbi:MAG: tRNA (guanosine(37)-N1)-methyltransferase TrmD [Chloroflexi bacterium]|nr:tRNA (guanosine(37)-N1)-methyltransferase TrmD [Chloroflexota bacterium]
MRFDILTLFPQLFDAIFSESILAKAQTEGLAEIRVHNIRDWALDKHHITDDTPYGGGGGMVMKAEPILLAIDALLGEGFAAAQKASGDVKVPIILLTPTGTLFNQTCARTLEGYSRMILICGRYEGVDERVSSLAVTHELSIGDYVLSGGEIAAMVVVEAVTRLVPGVLGDMRAMIDDSHSSGLLEYPHYTKPAEVRGLGVPEVLTSGNHARIAHWRREQALLRTRERRPDMLAKAELTQQERDLLANLEADEEHSHQPE